MYCIWKSVAPNWSLYYASSHVTDFVYLFFPFVLTEPRWAPERRIQPPSSRRTIFESIWTVAPISCASSATRRAASWPNCRPTSSWTSGATTTRTVIYGHPIHYHLSAAMNMFILPPPPSIRTCMCPFYTYFLVVRRNSALASTTPTRAAIAPLVSAPVRFIYDGRSRFHNSVDSTHHVFRRGPALSAHWR